MEVKNAKTFTEQMAILKAKGCTIEDETGCLDVLASVNYYRLSAYFLPYRADNHKFKDGTSFYTVYRSYEFDRKMREILWSIIGVIEINRRTRFAYYHAHKYGALGYMDQQNYNNRHDHKGFLKNFQREVRQNKRVPFVRHHIDKYENNFPIWVAVELFSFGMLSRFYADMKRADQKALCKELGHPTDKILASWLRCCTDLRNICAHYGRLYFRTFSACPATAKGGEYTLGRDLFSYILMLKRIYPFPNQWHKECAIHIIDLVTEYMDEIILQHIGFPENWCDYIT